MTTPWERGRPARTRPGRVEPRRGKKTYPRRATKDGEGPLRGWRGIDRDPPKVGKGVRDEGKRFIQEGPLWALTRLPLPESLPLEGKSEAEPPDDDPLGCAWRPARTFSPVAVLRGRLPRLRRTAYALEPRRGKKTYPRRATKDGEGPLRGWRGIDRDPPKVGKGVCDEGKRFIQEGPLWALTRLPLPESLPLEGKSEADPPGEG